MLQLLGLCPQIQPGLYPWTLLGDFRPVDPSCSPLSKFLATAVYEDFTHGNYTKYAGIGTICILHVFYNAIVDVNC